MARECSGIAIQKFDFEISRFALWVSSGLFGSHPIADTSELLKLFSFEVSRLFTLPCVNSEEN